MIKRNTCFLCGVALAPVVHAIAKQLHPEAADCEALYTDEWGIAVDLPENTNAPLPLIDVGGFVSDDDDDEAFVLNQFPRVDDVLMECFDAYKLPRLGGQSSGRGWSSFSLFQRCPYAWQKRYLEDAPRAGFSLHVESPALAIGSLIHTFLALHYTGMMEDSPYRVLTPDMMYEYARSRANPEFVGEAWRVFMSYAIWYQHEQIIPLAVEFDLRDPRTHESCRYDLIAYFPDERPGFLPGTYIVESKSASRFDKATTDGWANDGECLGEVALWQRMGLDKRFGPLRGLMVNILGKQKEPKFHRTVVSPTSMQLASHLRDLKRWEGLMNLAKSMEQFPRARNGCIGRYGMCDQWEHCATASD